MAFVSPWDFNPSDPCLNLLSDSDSEVKNGSRGFSFLVPAARRFTVVLSEHNNPVPFSGCANYSLELHGLQCPQAAPTLHVSNDTEPDNVRLHWSTAYSGFQLQGIPRITGEKKASQQAAL